VSYAQSQKINAHVNFDYELDLSDYCVADTPGPLGDLVTGDHMYDLVSVIMHHGTGFGSGHYSSYNWNNIAGVDCVSIIFGPVFLLQELMSPFWYSTIKQVLLPKCKFTYGQTYMYCYTKILSLSSLTLSLFSFLSPMVSRTSALRVFIDRAFGRWLCLDIDFYFT